MPLNEADVAWFAAALTHKCGGTAALRAAMNAEAFERQGAVARAQDWRAVEVVTRDLAVAMPLSASSVAAGFLLCRLTRPGRPADVYSSQAA